jgi:hypothetical protein
LLHGINISPRRSKKSSDTAIGIGEVLRRYNARHVTCLQSGPPPAPSARQSGVGTTHRQAQRHRRVRPGDPDAVILNPWLLRLLMGRSPPSIVAGGARLVWWLWSRPTAMIKKVKYDTAVRLSSEVWRNKRVLSRI